MIKEWKCSTHRRRQSSERQQAHDLEKHWTYMNIAYINLPLPPLWGDAMPIVIHCWHAEISSLSCYISIDPHVCKDTPTAENKYRPCCCCHESAPCRLKEASVEGDQHPNENGGSLHTNRQLLPGDIIGSTGVANYQVRGTKGCPAELLWCYLVPYHGATLLAPTAYPEDPPHKHSIFYRKLCVPHNQCLKEIVFWWKLACFSQQFRSSKDLCLRVSAKTIRKNGGTFLLLISVVVGIFNMEYGIFSMEYGIFNVVGIFSLHDLRL